MSSPVTAIAGPASGSAGKPRRVNFGVTVTSESASAIDARVRELCEALGVVITRSSYLELLAKHDRAHHIIEEVFARLK